MSTFACLVAGVVVGQLFSPPPGQGIAQTFPPDMTCWTDVSSVSAPPGPGWMCSESPLACAAPVPVVLPTPAPLPQPLTSLGMVNGHVVGLTSGTTLDPGPLPLASDVGGTTAATVVPRWRPGWTTVALSAGATAQLVGGLSVYDLTGPTLLAMATVRLPANPSDRDTVRLVAMGQLAITLLSVQDATGATVQSAFGLSTSATALYQFQGAAWVRIGS